MKTHFGRLLLLALGVCGLCSAQTFQQIPALHFVKPFAGANPLPQILSIASTGNNYGFTASASTSSGGSWLSVSPSGFCCTTPAPVSVRVDDASNLPVGTYTGQVSFTSGSNSLLVSVTLVVAAVNSTYFDNTPGHLSFTMRPGEQPPPQTIPIRNAGTGDLNFSPTVSTFNGGNFLSVSATSSAAPASITVSVNRGNLPGGGSLAGTYTGRILLQGSGTTTTIPVSVSVGTAEFEQTQPLHFVKVFAGGNPAPQIITGATLGTNFSFTSGWSTSKGGDWLAVSPSGFCCTTPEGLTVRVTPASTLAAGTYTGQVLLTTANKALVIPVVLTIIAPGSTSFDNLPGQLSFSLLPGATAAPPSQQVDLRKIGSGALSWTLIASTFDSGAWLNVSSTSGSAPSLLSVGINPANLPNGGQVNGTFVGHLLFQAGVESITIPIVVSVGPGFGQINPIAFTMQFAGPNPLPQALTIASTGAQFSFTVSYFGGSGGDWLRVSPSGFCCTTPEAIVASVEAPVGLLAGFYTALITLKAGNVTHTVPVTLTVVPAGAAFLDNLPGQLTFSAKTGNTPAPQPLRIRSRNGGSLSWTVKPLTSDGGSWLVVSGSSGSTPASVNVSINRALLPNAGLVAGVFTGQLLVETSGGGSFTVPISVELGDSVFGQINGIHFTMLEAGPDPLPQTITPTSTGANFSFTTGWATSAGGDWLRVSPSGFCCTTPRALRVSVVAPSGLAAGTYTGHLLLTRGTTSQTVPVTLTVLAANAVGFDDLPGQLYFATRNDGSSPPVQTIQIRNRGTGSLSWTAQATTFDNGSWLSVSAFSGTAPSFLNVNINAANLPNAGLVAGVYTGQIFLISGAGESTMTIPIVVAVGGSNPTQVNGLHYTMPLAGANPLPQNFTITSSGSAFSYTASRFTSTGGSWFTLRPTGFCCSTPEVMNGVITAPTGLTARTYTGQVEIATNTVTQTIPITLTVAPTNTPFFDNVQGQASFSATTSSSGFATQRVRIRNRGSGSLNWTLKLMTFDGGNWLTTTATSGTAPSSIELGIIKSNLPNSGLVDGSFTGQALFEAGGSSVSIPVSVVLGAQTFAQLGEIVLTAPLGNVNSSSQTVNVTSTSPTNFSFTASADSGNGGAWLRSSRTGFCCTTPESLTLSALGANIPNANGTYTGQLFVTRTSSAMTVPVILVVGNGGSTPLLASISITAPSGSLSAGSAQQFTATGTYSDNSTANITSQVTWTSSNPSVATIGTNTGLATGVAAGSTNITASLSGVTSTPFALTVTGGTTVLGLQNISPTNATSGTILFTINGTGFNPANVRVEFSNGQIIPNSALTTKTATQLAFTATLGVGNFTVLARNGSGGAASVNSLTVTLTPPNLTTGSHFVPITPCRAADTRNTSIIPRDSFRNFTFGPCNIPSNATAVAMNVTLVPNGPFGFLSLWPAGQAQPVVSTMNSLDGRIKANAAVVGLGAGGAVSVYVTDPAHVILDINGYFVPAGTAGALAFYPVAPCRVVDTRDPGAGGIIAALGTRKVSGGCLPAQAQAYSLNVTVVPPAALGFLSLWPDGSAQPTVSTLNNLTGTVVANAAILRAGTAGAFNAFVTDQSHMIVDLNGYFAPPGSPGALAFYPLQPCRIFDTRNANGAFGGPQMAPDATREFTVPSSGCGVPAEARAYVTNATVVPSGVFGFLTLWPGDQTRPTVSTLNAVDGALTSNAAILPASSSGVIRVYTSNATHLLLDISGYFAP
jgi:hypothetical protein